MCSVLLSGTRAVQGARGAPSDHEPRCKFSGGFRLTACNASADEAKFLQAEATATDALDE